jgi:hypothetical protein
LSWIRAWGPLVENRTQLINTVRGISKSFGERLAKCSTDCDFERLDGYLFVPPGDSMDELDKELEAAHRAGLTEVESLGSGLSKGGAQPV